MLHPVLAGTALPVTFQQNLNHWHAPKPGFFDVSIAYTANPSAGDFVTLHTLDDYPAQDMVTQTNFTFNVQLPAGKTADHAILQLRYVSYNPDEVDPATNTDAIFYNCADLQVLPLPQDGGKMDQAPVAAAASNVKSSSHASASPSCETPPLWSADALEMTPNGVVTHSIVYDRPDNSVYWKRVGALESSGNPDQTIILISNYTSLLEYVITSDDGVNFQCAIYGPDHMYPWAYGDDYSMSFVRSFEYENSTFLEFANPTNGVRWVAQSVAAGTCAPFSLQTQSTSMHFSNVNVLNTIDISIFNPPAICKKPELLGAKRGCRGGH